MASDRYQETVPVPRAVRFPVELRPPVGFCAQDPSTWPRVEGRVEYVGGRLLYMPPSGGVQGGVAVSVVSLLDRWRESHPGFFVGGNEQGMLLGGEVRAADAAVWSRDVLEEVPEGYIRVPPKLAVEIAGRDDAETDLKEKARWYLERGVQSVWIVLPATREVLVIAAGRESRHGPGQSLPLVPDLPDLTPHVDDLFRQLDGG